MCINTCVELLLFTHRDIFKGVLTTNSMCDGVNATNVPNRNASIVTTAKVATVLICVVMPVKVK